MTTEAISDSSIRVEVVYALPERYWSVRLQLQGGTTVSQALAAAREQLAEGIEVDPARLAIFGRPTRLSTVLRDGDRLEVLRPLPANPMDGRRARALDSPPKKR